MLVKLKTMSLKKTLNILILLSLIFVLYQSIQYYKYLNSIVCIGLQAPPEYYALKHLIPFIGIMLIIPISLIFVKWVYIKWINYKINNYRLK